jgi:hypothetical protein
MIEQGLFVCIACSLISLINIDQACLHELVTHLVDIETKLARLEARAGFVFLLLARLRCTPSYPVTILNFIPNSSFRMRGNTTDEESGPVPASMAVLVFASAMVFTAKNIERARLAREVRPKVEYWNILLGQALRRSRNR